ncbi:MAG: N-acetylmuramoyl-L-alanine amidase [Desulfovibrio sp.]|nr:N-acetylmuramoyl-L-alanine amidase [Desulfovibrio sp.]
MAKSKGEKSGASNPQALLRRILPSLTFAAALVLLVAIFYDSGYTTLPNAEKRYEQAKRAVAALRLDDKNAALRESWEKLAAEFRAVYEDAPDWINRPAALFRVAESLEELSRRSLAVRDARRAVDVYEELAARHPQSPLADDALFRSARIRAAWLKDEKGAIDIISAIKKRYPGGDAFSEAVALEKTLTAAGRGRTAPEARKVAVAEKREIVEERASSPALAQSGGEGGPALSGNGKSEGKPAGKPVPDNGISQKSPTRLTTLSWDSKDGDSVEITLVLSGPASCTSRMLKSGDGGRMRLTLDKVLAVREVEEGVAVRDSLLRGIQASRKSGATVLDIDFRREVDIVTRQEPGRIVLLAEAAQKAPTRPRLSKADIKDRSLGGMADQLGLTVGTVFIDAGHGGRDPGAERNNVLERRVTLDVALTLGRLLEASGLNIVYSRMADKTIPLGERARMANVAGADLFVSVHVNANDDPAVNGFETYYLDFAANAEAARVAALENSSGDGRLGDMQRLMAEVMVNARVEESRRLAGDIQRSAVFRLKRRDFAVRDNGVKAAPFHVLIGAHMPAVLVELGYCTNGAEAAKLANPAYRHVLAEGLAEGILAYKNRLKGANRMRAGLEQ